MRDLIDEVIDSTDGNIVNIQDTIEDAVDRLESSLDMHNKRLTKYRARLTKQFTRLESITSGFEQYQVVSNVVLCSEADHLIGLKFV